jgi:hypothetical protein
MISGMAIVRANTKQRQLIAARDNIITTFAGNPHTKYRTTFKVAKAVILGAPYIFRGRLRDVKAKSLGAGVYELSLELKE